MGELPADGLKNSPPSPPCAPEPGECCQSGCERCVYDLYWDALARYEVALEDWHRRHGPHDLLIRAANSSECTCRLLGNRR